LPVKVLLIFVNINTKKFFGSHAGPNAHAYKKMENINQFFFDRTCVKFFRVFPPFEVYFVQKLAEL
jgi:hypothetical protein